jgi:hypothetical protein
MTFGPTPRSRIRPQVRSRFRVDNTAVLRIGPFYHISSPASPAKILAYALAPLAAYVGLFAWYANTAIAHVYPDTNGGLGYGLMHGFFVVPSFVLSWFDHSITIYQSPNIGFWYNLAYLIGLSFFVAMVRPKRKRR